MRKLMFLAVICLLASASQVFTASADNYFTLRTATVNPVNDTLWLNPSVTNNNYCKMYVVANFDGYLDHWYLKISHPTNMPVYVYDPVFNNILDLKITEGPDMQLPYLDSEGHNQVLYADMTTKTPNESQGDTIFISHFASTINTMGYWDPYNNNHYETYGTVKWATGYYNEMFSFGLRIPDGVVNCDLILDLTLTSTSDWRGVPAITSAHPIRNLHIHVGYQRGDVNGDGMITVTDLSQLQDWLLFGFDSADPYQLEAADVDGDGVVEISDVSALAEILLSMNFISDLSDI